MKKAYEPSSTSFLNLKHYQKKLARIPKHPKLPMPICFQWETL